MDFMFDDTMIRTGADAWLTLRKDLLCQEGKRIVSKDPNLSDGTMETLQRCYGGQLREVKYYFGRPFESDTIGLTALSMCIKDNLNACIAELVARYCEMRRLPFLETAMAIKKLQRERGLFYYANDGTVKAWYPKVVSLGVRVPGKRKIG